MSKYYVGCEGTQDEFYAFLLDLAQKVDWALHPWEQPTVKYAMGPVSNEIAIDKEAIAKAVAAPKPKQQEAKQDAAAAPKEEPKVAPKEEAEAISLEDLRAKAIDLGRKHGNEAMKSILAKVGVSKLSAMDGAQRNLAAQLIQEATGA